MHCCKYLTFLASFATYLFLQVVEEKGITFDQFGCLAACNSLSVQMVRGDNQLTEDRLRQDIKAVTMAADKVITISYNRNTFGQTGELKTYLSPS